MTLRERQAAEYAAEAIDDLRSQFDAINRGPFTLSELSGGAVEPSVERRRQQQSITARVARYIRRFGVHPAMVSCSLGVTTEAVLRDFEENDGRRPANLTRPLP